MDELEILDTLISEAAQDKERLSNIIRAITVGVQRGILINDYHYSMPKAVWDNIVKQAQGSQDANS